MRPELFSIPALGPLSEPIGVHAYGVAIAVGFVLATLLCVRRARQWGYSEPERFGDLAFYVLLIGLLGSRLLFIAVNWREYSAHPIEVLSFWRGGLVFYGGFIATQIYGYWWARRHQIHYLELADLMIPALALNHAFGRLGCFAAGCCYGKPTMMPWGAHFPADSVVALGQHAQGLIPLGSPPHPVHPTQLYEAGVELVLFAVIMLAPRKFRGQHLLTWLIVYPIARSLIEMYRGDAERGFVIGDWLSTSQFVSLLVALAAIGLVVYLVRSRSVVTEKGLDHG